jgi:urea carboxylase-associated protein 2
MSETSSHSLDPALLLWQEQIPGGAHWSGVIRRGNSLRVTAREAGANVSMLFYNYEQLAERYNMADTLKGQHSAFLTQGQVCYTDMGRVICSITADSCGWHDTIGGISTAALVARKYGTASYQEKRNELHRNAFDSLLKEVSKYGLDKRDLVANLNLFSKVTVDQAGGMHFVVDNCQASDFIDLRFEMHALVVLSTCQHPMDPTPRYAPKAIELTAWRSGTASLDDPCRNACPENQRAFINTERLFT